MTAIKRKAIATAAVTVAAVVIALPWIQGIGNRLIRFVSGQHLVGAPLPGRSRENLPSVAVESGNRLCCRMLYCDFRFPLPAGTRVASIEPVTRGFDTIKGSSMSRTSTEQRLICEPTRGQCVRTASKLMATALRFRRVPPTAGGSARRVRTAVVLVFHSSGITEPMKPNHWPALGAAIALPLHSEYHWRRASEAKRSSQFLSISVN